MKRTLKFVRNQFVFLLFIIFLFIIVATGNKSDSITTEDISATRSIKAIHLVSKYKPEIVKTKVVSSLSEIKKYGKDMPVKFSGVMTGYGPDCVGCGGRTGCPPSQNVTNGNILFNDSEYGKVNILASDKAIPCGSIVKITNSSLGSEVVGIVLDRGGAITGTKFDFLAKSEKEAANKIGKQYVTYEIVRWGW